MPLIARDLIQGGPLTYGLLLGAFGAGAVGGALLSTRLRQALSLEALVRVAFISFAVCAAVAGLSNLAALSIAAMALGGASWVLALSSFNATVQLSSPRWVVGRALALYQMATFGGMALGSWIWGVVADRYGTADALLIAAGMLVGGAALGLRLPLPELKTLNLDPLNRWTEPNLAIDVLPRSGPIVITIEYVIREADVVAFLAVMAGAAADPASGRGTPLDAARGIWKTRKSGSSAITVRPGWTMCGTISASRRLTPPWASGSGRCIEGRTSRAFAA